MLFKIRLIRSIRLTRFMKFYHLPDRDGRGVRQLMLIGACLTAWLGAEAQSSRSEMNVTIVVDSLGGARVTERYRVPEGGRVELQLLDRPCATVHDVTVWTYRDTIALAGTRNGPWRIFRDPSGTAYNADSSGFDVRYRVSATAPRVDIPVIHLTRPIPRREGDREGAVKVTVSMDADMRGRVEFPALARAGADSWSGSLVAAPSFVRVSLPDERGSAVCGEEAPSDGADGGLSWRFWTLVLIMVAWVPLYLAWARRTRDDDA